MLLLFVSTSLIELSQVRNTSEGDLNVLFCDSFLKFASFASYSITISYVAPKIQTNFP